MRTEESRQVRTEIECLKVAFFDLKRLFRVVRLINPVVDRGPGLLRLKTGAQIGCDPIDLFRFEKSKSGTSLRSDELNTLRSPTFLSRELPCEPRGYCYSAGNGNFRSLEVGRRPDRQIRPHKQTQIKGGVCNRCDSLDWSAFEYQQ